MRRDMDLIRVIMLKLEDWDKSPGAIISSPHIGEDFPIEGYTPEQVEYHYMLIVENRWIDTGGSRPTFGFFYFRALTGEGHDFVDSVRDEEVWAMTRDGAKKAGAFTLELLGQLAKGFAKKQIEKHTGIEL
ncbi:DUF2513 domain-containing protein [Pseudomonas sp. 102515]|uniref:DUF2513 domain-containing protein n=1 Tax=Pseudomonas sp. 102515 TaxID=3071568 RepID=UPI002800EA7B|nr:DUF2513 domain-containing protein [Pseudomonas sp. 102515]MDQ7915853.1 DUF2513 domain-containing protein [Pseudomonas sp. 102515]